ncbi:hypothetical protein D9757_011861 [Collybiopsis confluens]|uniref:DUF6534 domain-containing protein n=1 Tax=Collybiopsis confluens TaxID=2823264 RepID=A0A8H5FXX7_9AGAR|nr:hypothetical protein D9757_011861 [Collybiopsis confluens]
MSDIPLLLGPLLIGAYLSAILYGILIVQASRFINHMHGPIFRLHGIVLHLIFMSHGKYEVLIVVYRDRIVMRYFLIFLLLAETANVATDFLAAWEPLVAQNGSPRALEISPTGIHPEPILTSLISTGVQIFMGWRIRMLTSSRLLFGIIIVLAFTSLASGITSTIYLSMLPAYADFSRSDGPIYTWLITATAADVTIAVSMVAHLVRRRGVSPRTNSVINRIIRMMVQTGVLTSVAAIADLVTYAFSPIHLGLFFGKAIHNLFIIKVRFEIGSLNARIELNQMLDQQDDSFSIHLTRLELHPNQSAPISDSHGSTDTTSVPRFAARLDTHSSDQRTKLYSNDSAMTPKPLGDLDSAV